MLKIKEPYVYIDANGYPNDFSERVSQYSIERPFRVSWDRTDDTDNRAVYWYEEFFPTLAEAIEFVQTSEIICLVDYWDVDFMGVQIHHKEIKVSHNDDISKP